MGNGSPSAYLLWAILSSIFFIFLLVHLWLYDKFNCIKWDSGRQPGAFRRVMTYSYLATVPLLVVFSIAMANIKFQEGSVVYSPLHIIPRPVQLWSHEHRRWLFPLNLILSMAWAFEMVTHLEELAFWLFLLHQGPEKRVWFESWEYKTWSLGSMLAVVGLPLTAVVTRNDIERTQAWIFLVGSTADTSTTISFLYILFRFPIFIQQVKQGGAAPDVVVRLATFYNLNRIRVVFRFLFTVPLLTIGVDAFFPPYRVILNLFALDFLLMIGGIGCFVSSAITLFVFFPRSMTQEAGYTTRMPSVKQSDKGPLSPQEDVEYAMSASKHFFSPSGPAYHLEPIYHPTTDGTPEAFVRLSHEHDEWILRGSAELSSEAESSPGYESDVDGLSNDDMSSPRSRHIHTERQESKRQDYPERHDTTDTAVSPPISGDTVYHRPKSLEGVTLGSQFDTSIIPQSPSLARLRRHSDTPPDSKNGRVVFPSRVSEDRQQGVPERGPSGGKIEKRTYRTQECSGPVIHPYLMNFISPIDLLDIPSETHPSRMV